MDIETIDDGFDEDDPDDSGLLEIDDEFPPGTLEPLQIIEILEKCWNEKKAFVKHTEAQRFLNNTEAKPLQGITMNATLITICKYKLSPPCSVKREHWNIEEKEQEEAMNQYETQCPVTFNKAMKEDTAITKLLAVGQRLNAPYLHFLGLLYVPSDRECKKSTHNELFNLTI